MFVFVSDMQLNQDPTDRDSWTFQVDSSPMVFYQAFDYKGGNGANGTDGLTNLFPFLARLGFEDNGFMEIDLGQVLELKPNGIQPSEFVSDETDSKFHVTSSRSWRTSQALACLSIMALTRPLTLVCRMML